MTKTKEWAESQGIDPADILPPAESQGKPNKRTAKEIAVRTIILHAIVAAAHGIDRASLIQWLKNQNLWSHVSPREQEFLLSNKPRKLSEEDRKGAQWLQEAQWTLLWTIQKIPSLGLPIRICNTIKIIDEIMPGLGSNTETFISTSELRPEPELWAEDDRISRLYDAAHQASRQNEMPEDLIYGVLAQRRYSFQWIYSGDEWDDVKVESASGS